MTKANADRPAKTKSYRLLGGPAVLPEQHERWRLEGRRIFSAESMAAIPEWKITYPAGPQHLSRATRRPPSPPGCRQQPISGVAHSSPTTHAKSDEQLQLAEDDHPFCNRIGAPLFSFLCTLVMKLLRRGVFRSIHAGQQELAHDIGQMLALGGISKACSDVHIVLAMILLVLPLKRGMLATISRYGKVSL